MKAEKIINRMWVTSRAGNMGQAQWVGSNWLDILEDWIVKLVARIEFEPIEVT